MSEITWLGNFQTSRNSETSRTSQTSRNSETSRTSQSSRNSETNRFSQISKNSETGRTSHSSRNSETSRSSETTRTFQRSRNSKIRDKPDCVCYDERSLDENNPRSRLPCTSCDKFKIFLSQIDEKNESTTFLLGVVDQNISTRYVKIISRDLTKFDPIGVALQKEGKSYVAFSMKASPNSLKTEILPECQQLYAPRGYNDKAFDLLNQYLDDENSKICVSCPRDAAVLYCEQPLVPHHADCRVCEKMHVFQHWEDLRVDFLPVELIVPCYCWWSIVKAVGPHTVLSEERMTKKIMILATIEDLNPDAKRVRLRSIPDRPGKWEVLDVGSPVFWFKDRAYVGVTLLVLNNAEITMGDALAVCQIRCLPDSYCIEEDDLQALVLHNFRLPGPATCDLSCKHLLSQAGSLAKNRYEEFCKFSSGL